MVLYDMKISVFWSNVHDLHRICPRKTNHCLRFNLDFSCSVNPKICHSYCVVKGNSSNLNFNF